MKTNDELRMAAWRAVFEIKMEIEGGGGKTLVSLTRMITYAQTCAAAINQLKERANGTAREEGK